MNREQAMKLAEAVLDACDVIAGNLDISSVVDIDAIVDAHVAQARRPQMDHAEDILDMVGQQEPVALRHLAVCDEGILRWMAGIAPRDCELYAMPNGGRAPAVLYTAPPSVAVSNDFPLAFITTESGGGEYKLVMSFGSMADMHRAHNQVLAALAAAPKTAVDVPDGWQLVPVEPTQEMIAAVCKYDRAYFQPTWAGTWREFLAAAPKPEVGAV